MSGVFPTNLALTVATAGTAVQVVTSASILPSTVYFEAKSTNLGPIYVGVSSVNANLYMARLVPGQGFTFSVDMKGAVRLSTDADIQLNKLYINAPTASDVCMVSYNLRLGG